VGRLVLRGAFRPARHLWEFGASACGCSSYDVMRGYGHNLMMRIMDSTLADCLTQTRKTTEGVLETVRASLGCARAAARHRRCGANSIVHASLYYVQKTKKPAAEHHRPWPSSPEAHRRATCLARLDAPTAPGADVTSQGSNWSSSPLRPFRGPASFARSDRQGSARTLFGL